MSAALPSPVDCAHSGPVSPEHKARLVAEVLWAQDAASRALGMELIEVGVGRARFGLTVEARHCNSFGVLHGGLLAALADSAFAFACNSHNALTLASGFEIDILKSSQPGDRLVAEARCVHQGGRSGLYDVEVRRGAELVAVFRGRSQRLRDRLVRPELEV